MAVYVGGILIPEVGGNICWVDTDSHSECQYMFWVDTDSHSGCQYMFWVDTDSHSGWQYMLGGY